MKNKAFTLIELLAVIIILGILMIIAIPSVTSYINDSRKSTYVSTVQELIKAASNKVNSGEFDMYDTDTTYYIPVDALELENGKARSPYDEFDEAYIVVTYDGEEYDYYYVGKDKKDLGISTITKSDLLNKDLINTVGNVDTTIALDEKETIVVFKSDLTIDRTLNSTNTVYGDELIPRECPSEVTETIYWALQDKDGDGLNEVLVLADHEVEGALYGNFSGDTKYLSPHDVPWIRNGNSSSPDNLSYNVKKVSIEGIIAPVSLNSWFWSIGGNATSFVANLRNIETCHVTDMRSTFTSIGRNTTDWSIKGIENWDTSKVTNMKGMFYQAGYNASSFKLDLSKWDVSNVTNLADFLADSGHESNSWTVGDISNWDTSSLVDMDWTFLYAGSEAETFYLDISGWNTSKVNYFNNTFYNTGYNSTYFMIKIPKTNSAGIDNTTTRLYGSSSSNYATNPKTGKLFTVAD